MSKRFTETSKFDDPWYCDLSLMAKVAWEYILCKCDNAGVWEPNLRIASAYIPEIDWKAVLEELGERIVVLENGKWWAWKFIKFQYGNLSEYSKPHQHVIRLLKDHGIYEAYVEAIESGKTPNPSNSIVKEDEKTKGIHTLSQGYGYSLDTLQDKDKDKDKDKGIGYNEEPARRSHRKKTGRWAVLPSWMTEDQKQAYGDWTRHIDELGTNPTNMQQQTWLSQCQRNQSRIVEVIQFSISKGAKSLIWDAISRNPVSAKERDFQRTNLQTTAGTKLKSL